MNLTPLRSVRHEKSFTRMYKRHLDLLQRFPWNMIGWKNWVQKVLYKQKFPNQPNQIQIIIERRDPLFALRERTTQVSKHNTSQTRSSRDCKSIDLETLFAHKLSALFLMRWTLTSEYLDFHIQLWNKLKALVFVNSLTRSGTTITDKIFNTIYDKIMPTTHLVKIPRKWYRTWAM